MSPRLRKHLWLAGKSLLAMAILVGVARYFAGVLASPAHPAVPFRLRLEYLVPAGLLYLLAHICWGSFWVRLLRGQNIPITLFAGLRCYFVSQFGKYIPGKAWVIVMRVGMLGSPGTKLAVGLTATYETLTSMAAGTLLGVALLPYLGVLPPAVAGNNSLLFGLAGLPIALALLNKLAARIAAKRRGPDATPLPSPSLVLMAQGLLHGVCGWCLLGLSLALVIRAVVPEPTPWTGQAYLGDVGAVGLSYVLGFVVLVAPGGLGVRELVLQQVLTRRFLVNQEEAAAAGTAAVVALVLRLVWTVAELVLATALWAWRPSTPVRPEKE
jgi:glycosyltransferase 2 family protein